MAQHIPRNFIDELLAKTDIVSVIEKHIPLKKAGANYSALCPFHNEKSPSFSISPSKQFYYCFGCGASGNALGFLMAYERLAFIDAIEILASQAGMTVPTSTFNANPDYQALIDLMSKLTQFYRVQLAKHPESKKAQIYLRETRNLSQETIKRFSLGYAPPGWDNVLRTFQPQQALLLKTGALIENDNGKRYDRFRDRIMFPIHDRRGRVIGFGGRVLSKDQEPKYLNSPETSLFHKGQELYGLYEARQATQTLEQLVVVEGYMDVISLAEHGVTYAVATLGTAITANHLRKLLSNTKKIIFCFDGDLAGQKAAWKALEVSLPLLTEACQLYFIFMPSGEDPDTFIQKNGLEAFEKQIAEAQSLSAFLLDHLAEEVNLETVDGRARLISLAIPYIDMIAAPITKELITNELAKISHTPTNKIEQWTTAQKPAPTQKKVPNITQKTPVRSAVSLLLQHPKAAAHIKEKLPQGSIPGLKLLEKLLEIAKSTPGITTGGLIEHWRDKPELPFLTQLASVELITPETGVASEIDDIFKHLKKLSMESEIESLLNKARSNAISADERKQLQVLLSEKGR